MIEHDAPWEGNATAYHSIFKDGDRYRMYYHGSSAAQYVNRKLLEPGEEMIPAEGRLSEGFTACGKYELCHAQQNTNKTRTKHENDRD